MADHVRSSSIPRPASPGYRKAAPPNAPAAAAAPPRHRMGFQTAAPQPHSGSKPDPFYGHESIARLCGQFITHLFDCPEQPPNGTQTQSRLPYFIAYALHRTKLHPSVTFAALVLLQRLKARFPTARGSSGHRLFISAFMIASKVICDDTYSNKSWSIVAQQMFSLREINQMEREMCSYLEWELTVDNPILENFEKMVKRDFRGVGPYPTYSLQMVSKRAARAAAQAAAPATSAPPSSAPTPMPPPNTTTSAIPMFGQQQQQSSPPKPSSQPPSKSTYGSSPSTPDTPSPSYSNSTSPASSVSPQTPNPPGPYYPKILTGDQSPGFALRKQKLPNGHPLKGKIFAYAFPARW